MRQIIVECDSRLVVDKITNRMPTDTAYEPIILAIQQLLSKDWEVKIQHIYREANACADWLSKVAYQMPLGLHLLDHCPLALFHLLVADTVGVSWPRSIVV